MVPCGCERACDRVPAVDTEQKAAAVIKQFCARDPTSYNFAVTALVPNTE